MSDSGLIPKEKLSKALITEGDVARRVKDILTRRLSEDYIVHTGKDIFYKIQINALGRVTLNSLDDPTRGSYTFQTDVLIEKKKPSIPLVVVELKLGNFSSHDVITYSAKASRHKDIYPYLRYGFIVAACPFLGRRFVMHNQSFNFALALPDVDASEDELVSVIQKQITIAERLSELGQSHKINLTRYEEMVDFSVRPTN